MTGTLGVRTRISKVIAHSKVTAQGQISVPAELRKELGIGPGSVLEWHSRTVA